MPQFLNAQDNSANNGTARLAEKLVRRLGVEDALRVCQDNSWHGVVRFIQGHMSNGSHS